MPNPTVKPIGQGGSKWKDRAGSASGVYKDGVQQTTKNWASAAQAGSAAWKQGVTAAVAGDRFAKGVSAAGNETWKSNTIAKGPDRYTQGVGVAEPKYVKNAAPYYSAISSVSLPERGARGSQQNYGRVAPIGQALHQLKMGSK
jgi:hypothetical protein